MPTRWSCQATSCCPCCSYPGAGCSSIEWRMGEERTCHRGRRCLCGWQARRARPCPGRCPRQSQQAQRRALSLAESWPANSRCSARQPVVDACVAGCLQAGHGTRAQAGALWSGLNCTSWARDRSDIGLAVGLRTPWPPREDPTLMQHFRRSFDARRDSTAALRCPRFALCLSRVSS